MSAGVRVGRINNIVKIMLTIAVFVPMVAAAAEPGDGKLLLKNIPDDIVFYVNGLSRSPDDTGGIAVAPGPVLLEIKQQRVVVYSTLFTVDSSEEKTILFDCTADCALLHVMTEPSNATLSMNGIILGTTPYLNRFVRPGEYSIMATYPGRIPVVRRIALSLDSAQIFSFTMEQTQAVRDSIAAVRRTLHLKRQMIQSIGFGGLGIGLAVAGAWFDHEALRHLDNASVASAEYNKARTDETCRKYKNKYLEERKQAGRPIIYRNIFYSAATVCVAGFYLSFVF